MKRSSETDSVSHVYCSLTRSEFSLLPHQSRLYVWQEILYLCIKFTNKVWITSGKWIAKLKHLRSILSKRVNDNKPPTSKLGSGSLWGAHEDSINLVNNVSNIYSRGLFFLWRAEMCSWNFLSHSEIIVCLLPYWTFHHLI